MCGARQVASYSANMTPSFLSSTGEGVLLRLRVQPRASKSGFAGVFGDAIRLKIHAPPVDGAANEASQRFLADFFSLPLKSVHLVSGHASRIKVFLLRGMTVNEVARRLSIVL